MKGPVKTSATQGKQLFPTVNETAQGGFTLDKTGLTDGQTIPGGSVMGYDESTRKARVIKSAVMFSDAGGSDVAYNVKKGHNLAVGDFLSPVVGGKSYAITAIDTTTYPDKDVVTVGTSLGAVLTGGVLFQSSASGATSGALIVTPRGLLYEDTFVYTNQDVAVVIDGTVYERRIPGVLAGIKALLPKIIFSQSY